MIQANELMIGNYVQTKDEELSVGLELMEIVGIYHDGSGFYNSSLSFGLRSTDDNHSWFSKDCELIGIPLTEEILLKCGFIDDTITFKASNITIHRYRNKDICLSIDKREIDGYEYHFFNENGFIRTIKYLHQLQNLYFALTSEELTVNL